MNLDVCSAPTIWVYCNSAVYFFLETYYRTPHYTTPRIFYGTNYIFDHSSTSETIDGFSAGKISTGNDKYKKVARSRLSLIHI